MKQYVVVISPWEPPYKKLWIPEDGLLELQSIVGGNVETVPTEREGYLLIVNEDGKNEQLPKNLKATKIMPHFMQVKDYIAGKAVLMKRGKEDVEPFSKEEAERWLSVIG